MLAVSLAAAHAAAKRVLNHSIAISPPALSHAGAYDEYH